MIFKTYKNTYVSTHEYADAVHTLLHIAEAGGKSSRAAAQVLLSTYNGYDFKMDLTDLCYLEGDQYDAAISAIRGRAETLREPHEIIENGDTIFRALRKYWSNTDLFG